MIKRVASFSKEKVNAFIIKHFPLTKFKVNKFLYESEGKKLMQNYKLAEGTKINEIVKTIKTDGIAVVKLEDIFPENGILDKLIDEFKNFENTEQFKNSLQKGESSDSKNYLIRSGFFNKELSTNSLLFKIGISKQFISIISNYLGSIPRIQFAEYWYTIPQNDAGNKNSQKWHRDPEFSMIKVFLYLNDVDQGAGPFCFIKGTHSGGPLGHILPRTVPNGPFYPPENEIFEKIDRSNVIVNTGSKGTLIFCDTNGFHKGGDAKTDPRIFAYWTYSGPGTLFNKYFTPIGDVSKMTQAEKFVLKM